MELKHQNEYCCMDKKRLVENDTWFKSIKINPKFVVFNKFKRCKTYMKYVEITNEDIKPRLFNIKFDFQPELDFLNIKNIGEQYILPQMSFKIEIYFEPISITEKRYKNNQRFNIFLETSHPNAIFEIPIMVIANPVLEPSIPIHINMPPTSPDIPAIYALVVCNLLKNQCEIDVKLNKPKKLKLHPKRLNIPPMECDIVLIETESENLCGIFEELYFSSLKLKWKHLLTVKGEIIPYNLYFHKNVNFENTLLGCYTEKMIQICNESKKSVKFKWCRKSTKAESCLNKDLLYQHEELKHQQNIKKIDNGFIISPKSGVLEPVSSISVRIYFCPASIDNDDIEKTTNELYPFQHVTNAYLADSSNPLNRQKITLTGFQVGPRFTIDNAIIDLQDVFVGQMQCLKIYVRNEDVVAGEIYFDRLESINTAELCCFPKSLRLKPGECKYFDTEFYVKDVGNFSEIAYFKVKWGEKIKIHINGASRVLNLIVNPDKLNFDAVPLCITHTKTIKVTNPLSLPITVICNTEVDGEEEPFALDDLLDVTIDPNNIVFEYDDNQDLIDNSQFFESLTRFPKKDEETDQISLSLNTDFSGETLTEQLTSILLPKVTDMDELSTKTEVNSGSISVRKKVADLLSTKFIKNARKLFKSGITDNRLMITLMENLMKEDYFSELCHQESLIQNNWDSLPNDPREYDVDKKILLLESHETTTITISLICNTVGPSTHTLLLQIADIDPDKTLLTTESCLDTLTRPNIKKHLRASNTITKIKMKHKGVIPEVFIQDDSMFDNLEVYVELPYEFNFDVVTNSEIPGFFYFKVFPRSFNAEMSIYPRVAYISNSQPLKVYAKLIAYETGKITLLGSYAVVGSIKPQKFKITCLSKPPELKIYPKKISSTQKVLETVKHRIFIENKSPTKARVFASVDSEDAEIEPKGCILGPNQIILFLLKTRFTDPSTYKFNVTFNAIYVGILKVLVVINVKGIPILTVPNIENSTFDFGTLIIGLKTLYEKEIIFMNHGKNTCKISLSKRNFVKEKLKDNDGIKCELEPMKFTLESGESKIITASVQSTKPYKFSKEFTVEASSRQNFHKYHVFNFSCIGEFVRGNISWNITQIVFELEKHDTGRSDTKRNLNAIEKKAILRNHSPISLNVELIVVGQFLLYDPCKRKATKNYEFQMKPKEHKTFEIFFDRSSVKESCNSQFAAYTGEIITKTEHLKQIKPILLHAQISPPTVDLCQSDYSFFTTNTPFFASIMFRNPSDCQLFYNISPIEENICPINVNYNENAMKKHKTMYEKIQENFSSNLFMKFIDVNDEFRKSLERFVFEESSDEENVSHLKKLSVLPENTIQIENISPKQNEDKGDLKKTKTKKNKISKKNTNSVNKNRIKSIDDRNNRNLDQIGQDFPVLIDISKQKFEETIISSTQINEEKVTDKLETAKSIPFEDVADKIHKFLENIGKITKSENFLDKYFSVKNIDVKENDKTANKTIENRLCLSNYEGCLKPKECKTLYLSCNKLEKDTVLNKKFLIEIPRGIDKSFEIFVYNYETKVEISQTYFNFGIQPWYKLISQNIKVSNTDERYFKVGIIENLYLSEYDWKLEGFVALQKPSNCIYLGARECFDINAIMYFGFNNCFKDGFGIEVNNNIATPVTFEGQGTMPMASILNYSRPNLKISYSECEVYKILNKIYKDIIEDVYVSSSEPTQDEINDFKTFLSNYVLEKTVISESQLSIFNYKEHSQKQHKSFTASLIALSASNIQRKDIELHNLVVSPNDGSISIVYGNLSSKLRYKNNVLKLDDDLKEFEILDYPESYPCQIHLEKLIDTETFLMNIKKSPEIKRHFKQIFNKYISNLFKNQEFKQTQKYVPNIPPKKFIIRPVPHKVETYVISENTFWLDEKNNIDLELIFHGPGRAIFAARNTTSLPGFSFNFLEPEILQNKNNVTVLPEFLIYQYTSQDPVTEKYKNYTERLQINNEKSLDFTCKECNDSVCDDNKICHPHSYDLQLDDFIHSRKLIDSQERKILYEHYSRLNQPHKEDKNPNVLCELYQTNSVCCDNTIFSAKIIFNPQSNFYQDQMIFEEYLYIDIHLGPTLPILVEGKISKREKK